MSAITDYARGRPCLIRVPGFCTFLDEQTVACHVPLAGYHGTGLKMADLFIAFGCSVCHDIVDRRQHKNLDSEYVRGLQLEGMIRTQHYILTHAPHLFVRFLEAA